MKPFFSFLALLLVSTLSLSAQDLQEGLVMHYPFEGNLTDTITGETAENNGNLTFADGKVGTKAVRFFTGTGDPYFVTPDGQLQVGPAADGGTAGTYALFVNHRGSTLATDRQNYIAQKNGCGPDDNNRGRVVLYRQGPSGTGSDSITSFVTGRRLLSGFKIDEDNNADTWVHLTLTIDPEIREWAIFADGVEITRDTFVGTTQAENSCGEYVIGHHLTFTTESQTFDGLMDDLRFYNRVLTQEEITMLANQFPTSTREELATDAMKLVPNPVSTNQPINVTIDQSVFRAGTPLQLNVVDASGRTVLEREYAAVTDQLTLDQRLKAGVYTLTLTNGERLATSRLVVQ